MEFDEKPIGEKSQGFGISEYPPDYDPNAKFEEPKEKPPLSIRIKSTVFKNRKEALEELIDLYQKTEDLNDPIFSEYTSLFSKFVADSNPQCLEKGLQAIQIWCNRQQNFSSFSEPTEFVKSIVEKALSTGKLQIVDASYEILSIFIEKGQKDDVLNALKMCFSHKNQKVQCCSIEAVLELLKRFGPRKLDHLKMFFPEIQKLCDSTISSIKTLCLKFFKESFKWIGSGVRSFTDKLSKQQIEELEKFFVEYKEEPLKPIRQSAQQEEQEFIKGNKGKIGVKLDEYELAIAQDIFAKFNEQWTEKLLALQKWSEKKELLDNLIKAASVPKLTPNNFSPVVQMCKKLLNDSNVQIQICAIKIIGLMASGIRKPFASSAKLLSSLLVDKFKDKKQPIVDEALKTLKNYLYCIQLDELAEDIKEALNDKNSGSKINAINLLLHCIEDEKYKNTFKQFFSHLRKLLDDSQEEVRNKCIQLVGKLKGYYTDSYTQQITLNLNQQKMQKIDQYASSIQPFQQYDPSSFNNLSEKISPPKPGVPQLKKNASQPLLTSTMNNFTSTMNNQKQQKNGLQPNQIRQIKQSSQMEIENDHSHHQISHHQNHQISNGSQRMDISKELENPLRKLQDQKQQSKKEGLDILEVLLQQANYKISSNGITDLVVALKKCLSESNKSLARQFISFIAKFGEALGKDAKFYAKTLVPGIIQNLQDKQALVRTEAQNTLEKWAELIGIEQIINFIPPFLGYESLDIRIQLMNYIIKHSEFYLKSDLKSFVIPILLCLTDKNKEIRTHAEQILEITLQDSVKDFKPAVVQQLRQIFEKYSDGKHDNSKASYNDDNNSSYHSQGYQKMQNESNMQNSNGYNSRMNYPQMKQQQPVENIKKQINKVIFLKNLKPLFYQNKVSSEALKEKRMDIQEQCPWPLDRIDDEQVEILNENIREVGIPNDLRLKMFSLDNSRVIEAAIFVKDKISTAQQISDLLFKWSFSRLWQQQNIQVCKIILEMLKQIFDCLKNEQYYIVDFELNIILQCFYLCMETHGNNSEILNQIIQAHENLRLISSSTKIIKYWINRIQANQTNCELIILVLNSGLFTSELCNELGQLSKIQSISSNKNIVTALLYTYGENVMKAYGFKIANTYVQNDKNNIISKDQKSQIVSQDYKSNIVLKEDKSNIIPKEDKINIASYQDNSNIALQDYKSNIVLKEDKSNIISKEDKINQASNEDKSIIVSNQEKSIIVQNQDKINKELKEDNSILEIKQNLYKLENKDINLKLYAIHFLNEAFQNPEQISILNKHGDIIITEITKYLSKCMIELRQKEIQFEFFNTFINLFIKITNTKQFFRSISINSAKNVTEYILTELILADENKDDKNSQSSVKQLNTLMLRVLENTQINNMFTILLNLLISNRRKNEYSKFIAIIIKCIIKLTKVLREDLKEVDIDQLFIKFHEYMSEFNHENQKSDDIGVKAIKTVINELAKILDLPKLMQHYKVLEKQPIKDQQIIKMIENVTSTKTIIHQSPKVTATPSNSTMMDQISQLKMRYNQIVTNKSPYTDDENLRNIQNNTQQNYINSGISQIEELKQSDENNSSQKINIYSNNY